MKRRLSGFLAAVLTVSMFTSPSVLCADSRSAQVLSEETLQYYEDWKDTYLKTDLYVSGEVQYYVFYGDETYEEAHSTVEVTVSEAHGYGILIAALMADYDSEAQDSPSRMM